MYKLCQHLFLDILKNRQYYCFFFYKILLYEGRKTCARMCACIKRVLMVLKCIYVYKEMRRFSFSCVCGNLLVLSLGKNIFLNINKYSNEKLSPNRGGVSHSKGNDTQRVNVKKKVK